MSRGRGILVDDAPFEAGGRLFAAVPEGPTSRQHWPAANVNKDRGAVLATDTYNKRRLDHDLTTNNDNYIVAHIAIA